MKIAFYNNISLLKFNVNKSFRGKNSNNIVYDTQTAKTPLPVIQGIYGKAFVNMQPDAALFDKAIFDLSSSLAKLSDEQFNDLNISQMFEKDDFITKVLSVTKDSDEKEKQRACSYFGFELYQNEENWTGFSILGYPFNPADSISSMQIENFETRQIINKLQPVVIKFSKNNSVVCNDKDIAKKLNEIVNFFPELRVLIGKKQHRNHDFDVMKHSLKVMQKIVQNPEFEQLNESDKKLLLIAALFHDIRKTEGRRDPNHALKGAADAKYITKKLNLTDDEERKLYSLIKSHGWLNYVNRTKTPQEEAEAQKTAAYDMRHGNLFEMMKIFTQADLKSTKNSDASYVKHKEKFEAHINSISNYIDEFKTL